MCDTQRMPIYPFYIDSGVDEVENALTHTHAVDHTAKIKRYKAQRSSSGRTTSSLTLTHRLGKMNAKEKRQKLTAYICESDKCAARSSPQPTETGLSSRSHRKYTYIEMLKYGRRDLWTGSGYEQCEHCEHTLTNWEKQTYKKNTKKKKNEKRVEGLLPFNSIGSVESEYSTAIQRTFHTTQTNRSNSISVFAYSTRDYKQYYYYNRLGKQNFELTHKNSQQRKLFILLSGWFVVISNSALVFLASKTLNTKKEYFWKRFFVRWSTSLNRSLSLKICNHRSSSIWICFVSLILIQCLILNIQSGVIAVTLYLRIFCCCCCRSSSIEPLHTHTPNLISSHSDAVH